LARNTNIKLRRSATAGAIPTTSNLDLGELALNTYDGKLYMKTTEGSLDTVIQVGSATDSYYKVRKSQTLTFEVKVASKTTNHIHYNSGSGSGYQIDGVESPHFNLIPGNTYRFDQSDSSNSGHPLRFYYDSGKTTAYTAGVTTNGTPGSSGAYTQIVPTVDTPMVLHYQCSAHGLMGNQVSFKTRNLTGFDTDDLSEGSSNLYFTNARARAAVSAGTGISYNSSTGVISSSITQYANSDVESYLDANGTTFPDNVKAQFGASNDLQIYHDGTSSYIINTTNDLVIQDDSRIRVRTPSLMVNNAANTENMLIATENGSVDLYYNNVKKLETTTGGINVTGSIDATNHISLPDSKFLRLGGDADFIIYHDGTTNYIQAVKQDSDIIFRGNDGGTNFNALTLDMSAGGAATFTDNVTVGGNLTVNGTTTTLNTATLDVEDKNITLNKGSGDTSGSANGAGLTIQDAVNASTDATLLWDASDDEFDFSHAITTPGATIASLTYPSSDGSSGQALVTDGSGNLSFSSISAGGNAFGTIAVSGQSNVAADSNSDTLTLVAGSNITLTTDASADSVTIAAAGGSSITVQEEGSSLSTAASTLNFVGSGVTASGSGATKTITVSGGALTIQDEGSALSTAGSTLNFVGGGVTASGTGATKTITIPGGSGSSQSALYKEYVYTPGSSTTTFTGSDANGSTLSYTVGYISVYLNGVLLKPTTDYTATNGTSVVLVNTAVSGDVIQIATFVQIVGTGDSSLSELTGNGSTTAFTIAANPNHENNTQVYIDGVYQEKGTYSVSGTTLTFSSAPPSGSSIEVVIGSRNVTVDDVSGLTVNGDASITGDLTVDTDTLYVDSTNNRVGIRTTSPASDLHIKTSVDNSVTQGLVIERSANTDRGYINYQGGGFNIRSTVGDPINLGETDAVHMRINPDGDIGIGTTSPSSVLHISDASSPEIRLEDSDATSTFNITTLQNASGTLNFNTRQDNGTFVSTDYQILKNAAGANIHKWFIGNSEKLRLDASGRLGIGTTSPGVSLDVGSLTDAIRVPNGTTGQRPTAALGQLRYNTTTSEFEGYADGAWGKIGGGGDSFGTIAVSGQTNIVAEQENDTLTIVGAGGITATTTAGTDTLTLTGQTSVNPFTTDIFSASGSAAFTLSVTPPSEDNLIVFLEGVYQNKNSYTLSGTTLTLDTAPVSGSEVVVHIIQNGVVGAGHVVDEFTGNGSTAAYTLSVTPLNENNTFVYLDGVYQEKSTYSVSGNTLTFGANVTSGHSIEVVTPQVSEINQPSTDSINAIGMFDDTAMMGSTVTSTTLTTTSASTIATHAAATYRTVKYLVQLTQGTDYHSTEINLIHDGTTVYITEYGTLFDNAALGTFDATITSGNILLKLTPGSNTSLTARVVSTAIPV